MGLCYATSRWLDLLWGQHLEMSQRARELVQQGIFKQRERFAGFGSDLHGRLYLPGVPAAVEPAPQWAIRLHELASELGEWRGLRLMCARNGFASGIATEALLETLIDHVPDRAPEQPSEHRTQCVDGVGTAAAPPA